MVDYSGDGLNAKHLARLAQELRGEKSTALADDRDINTHYAVPLVREYNALHAPRPTNAGDGLPFSEEPDAPQEVVIQPSYLLDYLASLRVVMRRALLPMAVKGDMSTDQCWNFQIPAAYVKTIQNYRNERGTKPLTRLTNMTGPGDVEKVYPSIKDAFKTHFAEELGAMRERHLSKALKNAPDALMDQFEDLVCPEILNEQLNILRDTLKRQIHPNPVSRFIRAMNEPMEPRRY